MREGAESQNYPLTPSAVNTAVKSPDTETGLCSLSSVWLGERPSLPPQPQSPPPASTALIYSGSPQHFLLGGARGMIDS